MAELLVPDYTIHYSSYEHRIVSTSWLLEAINPCYLDDIVFIGQKKTIDQIYVLKNKESYIKVKTYKKTGNTYKNEKDKKPPKQVLNVCRLVKKIEKIHSLFNGFLVIKGNKSLPFNLNDYCIYFGNSTTSFFKVGDKVICLVHYDCESG